RRFPVHIHFLQSRQWRHGECLQFERRTKIAITGDANRHLEFSPNRYLEDLLLRSGNRDGRWYITADGQSEIAREAGLKRLNRRIAAVPDQRRSARDSHDVIRFRATENIESAGPVRCVRRGGEKK